MPGKLPGRCKGVTPSSEEHDEHMMVEHNMGARLS